MNRAKVSELADCVLLGVLNPDADASMPEIMEALCVCVRHIALHNDIPINEVAKVMVDVWARQEEDEGGLEVMQ